MISHHCDQSTVVKKRHRLCLYTPQRRQESSTGQCRGLYTMTSLMITENIFLQYVTLTPKNMSISWHSYFHSLGSYHIRGNQCNARCFPQLLLLLCLHFFKTEMMSQRKGASVMGGKRNTEKEKHISYRLKAEEYQRKTNPTLSLFPPLCIIYFFMINKHNTK